MVLKYGGYTFDTIDTDSAVLKHPGFRRQFQIMQLGQIEAIHSGATQMRYDHGEVSSYIDYHMYMVLASKGREPPVARNDSVLHTRVHDIGHMTYSHLTEYLIKARTGIDHHENGVRILTSHLRDSRGRTLLDAIESDGGSPDIVLAMMRGDPAYLSATDLCRNKALGADKLAYTWQDALRVNFDQLPPSWEKLITSLTFVDSGLGVDINSHDGRFNDPIGVVEAMQNFYQRMYTEVYLHPASLSLERSIQRALEHSMNGGAFTPLEVLDFTDGALINRIKDAEVANDHIRQAHHHISAYIERSPWESVVAFKLDVRSKLREEAAFEIDPGFKTQFLNRFQDPQELTRLEERLSSELKHEVLISVLPDPEKVYPIDIPLYAGARMVDTLQNLDPSHFDRLNSQANRTFAIRVLTHPGTHEQMLNRADEIAEKFNGVAREFMEQTELKLPPAKGTASTIR